MRHEEESYVPPAKKCYMASMANKIFLELHNPANTSAENIQELKQNVQPCARPAQNESVPTIMQKFANRNLNHVT